MQYQIEQARREGFEAAQAQLMGSSSTPSDHNANAEESPKQYRKIWVMEA